MSNMTWEFSQTFSSQFQTARTELESRIDALKTSPHSILQEQLQELSVEVAKLTKNLADATGSLPSYDQRRYEQQLKTLENALGDLRVASTPKTKFAFRRKAAVAPSPPTSGVITPLETLSPSESPERAPQILASTNSMLSSRSHQYVASDSLHISAQQQDLTISDLDHCIVNLIPPPAEHDATRSQTTDPNTSLNVHGLHARNLTNTVLLLPPIDGSVLLHDLSQCTLVVACRQFRIHNSHNVDVFLSISSNPTIEHCSNIRFSGYPVILFPHLRETPSQHLAVQDFSHIRSTPSPHWSVLSDEIKDGAHWPLVPINDRQELCDTLQKLIPALP